MRVFIDLNSNNVVENPGIPIPIQGINFKRSPFASLEVQFCRNSRIVELPTSASGVFEIKSEGKYDADPVTGATEWTKSFSMMTITQINPSTGEEEQVEVIDPETVVYSFVFTLITVPLDTYFMVDGNVDNDVVSLKMMGEIEWTIDGSKRKTQTVVVNIANDVIREGDILPGLPPVSYGFFIPSITSLTGGTSADLDALPTVGLLTGTIIQILVADLGPLQWLTYILKDVPLGSGPPGVVEPIDYNATTNARRWLGAVGPSGPSGRSAGARYTWSSDVTESDPTSGKIKANAVLATATELYISETDLDGNLLQSMLASWDNGTSTIRGRILIQDPVIGTNFAAFDVTGSLSDSGGWDTFNITNVAVGGTFPNGLQVNVIFLAKGDKGDQGPFGLPYSWETDTVLEDPGAGKIALNNSDFELANSLYISQLDLAGHDLEGYLSTFANGNLYLSDPANPENFAVYRVFGIATDHGEWWDFQIEHVSSGGAFTEALPIYVLYIPAGAQGETGEQGPPGDEGPPGDAVYDVPVAIPGGASVTLDLETTTMSTLRVLTANTVVILSNPVPGKVTILHFKQAPSGTSFTLSFSGVNHWVGTGGIAPVMSPGYNVVDAFTIWNDGVLTYGSWSPGA